MLEQDIGQYLGMILLIKTSLFFLISSLNQLEEHWRKYHQSHPHALTILTKLFRNMDEVINLIRISLFFFLKSVFLVIKI